MSDVKIKGVSFNPSDPIEGFMLQHAEGLKEKKISFSGLMKNLYLSYLIKSGQAPPGLSDGIPSIPLVEQKEEGNKDEDLDGLENGDKRGIMKAAFSLVDEDDE